MPSLKWRFPPNETDEDEGLADAGIETFRDAPYSGLARECGQNSIDAAYKDPDTGETQQVVVRFRKQAVPTTSVPDINGLRETIRGCCERARQRGNRKEQEFFTRAQRYLDAESIEILNVIDEGTAGLAGPCEPGTPYHALVKGSGVSKKEDETSGGSFGIGKNAAYAVSALRTVFYSTVYRPTRSEPLSFLAQGKAILVSHSTGNDKLKGTGYWGIPDGYLPTSDKRVVPEWLAREMPGTTVTSLGFLTEEGWDWRIIESLIRNFFSAIHQDRIVFEVGEDFWITRTTLPELFNHKEVVSAAEFKGFEEELRFSYNMYQCLTSPDHREFDSHFRSLGKVRLYLLVGDNLEKKVGLIRNGMFVTSSFRHFKDKLARFNFQKDFIAVIQPVDEEAASNIRSLENPRHDELSPERIENDETRKALKGAINSMNGWIRGKINELTTLPPDDEVQLDDLNDFFSAPEDDADNLPDSRSEDKDPTTIKFTARSTSPSSGAQQTGGDEGGSGGQKPGDRGGVTSGPGTGSGKGGKGGVRGGSVPIEDLRNAIPDSASRYRIIYFTPHKSGKARLKLFAAGIAEEEELGISEIDGTTITNSANAPVLNLTEGERIRLAVQLSEAYEGPIEVGLNMQEGSDENQE